jgi:hypothetical protein
MVIPEAQQSKSRAGRGYSVQMRPPGKGFQAHFVRGVFSLPTLLPCAIICVCKRRSQDIHLCRGLAATSSAVPVDPDAEVHPEQF